MEKVIVFNGVTNPVDLLIENVLAARDQVGFQVKTGNFYDHPEDLIPTTGTAVLVDEEEGIDFYARHYLHCFTVPQRGDEETLGITLLKSNNCPDIIINFTEGYSFPSNQMVSKGQDPEWDMDVAVPKFVVDQLSGKLLEFFPFLTPEQVKNIVSAMRAQMAGSTERPALVFAHSLYRQGIPDDVGVDLFDTMMSDVGCAVAGLGIDILEPGASVSWTC